MDWVRAPDLQKEVALIIAALDFSHIKSQQVIVFRSYGSQSRARARIWGFPRIWQIALKKKPHYCLEVISEKFDSLPLKEKQKILIHELLHIPKTFSGSLLPHRGRGRGISPRIVDKFYRKYILEKNVHSTR